MNRDAVLQELRNRQDALARYGVRRLALFGSAVRNEARPDSDLDFLVEFEGPATYRRYIGLKLFLEDLFGRRADLVTRRALKPRLRPYVEQEAVYVA